MEGLGIWIFLLLFYLLQAITKNQQKKRRQEQGGQKPHPQKSPRPASDQGREPPRPSSRQPEKGGQVPKKPQEPVSLEDLFNPDKLRDILGVP